MEKTPPLSSMKRKREESDKVRNMDDATEDDTEDNIMMKDTQADARAETTADARATAAETRAASDVWNILDKYKKTLEEVMMMLVEANNTIDSYKKRAAELETKLAEVSRQQSNGSYHALRGTVQARADAEEEQLRSQIRATILTNGENEKWEDVVGLKVAKEILEETIFDPIRYPEAFEGKRKTSKGILLYGPPGTGKSHLAKAVPTEANCTFFSISSSDLISRRHDYGKLVKTLFERARESPCGQAVIFIDQIDLLSRKYEDDNSVRGAKNEFRIQMEGLVPKKEGSNVLVLGATNFPWDLEGAILSRFEEKVYIPLPDADARTKMIQIHLGDTPNNLNNADFKELGQNTEGYSGSDIKVLVKDALLEPLSKCQQAKQFKMDGKFFFPCEKYPNCDYCENYESTCRICRAKWMTLDDIPGDNLKAPDVEMRDFEEVLKKRHPTVSEDELGGYEEWTKKFWKNGN